MSALGYILFDKPAHVTSFAALKPIRKTYPGSKVGHCGTLDAFATGLLVVLVGAYSRLAPWFVGLDKVYQASFQFGIGTDTLDPVGTEDARGPIPDESSLRDSLSSFIGSIQQVPPRFSALHVKGQRASDLAMKGQEFELKARGVIVHSLELKRYDKTSGIGEFEIHCSSGTYVRSLARDIAQACGTCAHVSTLRRTRVGPFSEEQIDKALDYSLQVIDPPTALNLGLDVITLSDSQTRLFANGQTSLLAELDSSAKGSRDLAVFGQDSRLRGIVHNSQGRLSYGLVLHSPGEAC
jgi:tRNA pseudouridine55 synthase